MTRSHSYISVIFLVIASTAFGYRWPSPQYDALESFLYEGRRADGSNLASVVHPCKERSASRGSVGAEWLRLAFHDMATHNIDDGTGGLDGSIAFELDRPENFGAGMNASLLDFESFSNKYVSRSDIIALGAVFAVASCGGPIIPFRGGRIDALTAGPAGVPEPHQDLTSHTESFRRQGFTLSEMITLIACGHTIGGVRSLDFPDLVPPGDNLSIPNIKHFDTSPEFDHTIVLQYLDGTTANPLVVDSNTTMVSDRRIFSSDGNKTMHALASPAEFAQSCANVLERMINTVPAGVTLTEEITLLPAKVYDAHLGIDQDKVIFKASLRLTHSINSTASEKRTVKMFWCDKYGTARECNGTVKVSSPATSNHDDPNISPLTLRFGLSLINYHFVIPIDPALSISKFWFEVDEHDGSRPVIHNNEGNGYVIAQDQVFFAPTLSYGFYQGDFASTPRQYHLVAALRSDRIPSRVYMTAFDNALHNFAAPLNATVELQLNSTITPVEGYVFYTGVTEDEGAQLSIDLHSVVDGVVYTDDFRHTFFLMESAGSPPTPVETVPYPPPSTTNSGPLRTFAHMQYWMFSVTTFVLFSPF